MKLNKLIITISILTLIILGLGVWLLTKPATGSQLGSSVAPGARQPASSELQRGEPDEQGKAEVEMISFDWGTIDYGGGDATAEFTVKNSGVGPLSLFEVFTSCMCTTAQVIIGNQKSPFFGMHTKSSWVGKIPPGGEAKLKIVFDPAFHGPSGVGPVTRQIVMKTNDPQNPKLEFNLKGTVVK